VKISQFESLIEAETAKSALECRGIACFIENQYAGSMLPHVSQALGGIGILVESAHAKEARLLLGRELFVQSDEEGSAEDRQSAVESAIKRATYGALLGTFLLPLVANCFSIALYRRAYRMDPRLFRKKLGLFYIGLTFDVFGILGVVVVLVKWLLRQ